MLRYAREIPDARLSASNPNVYFRETPLLVVSNGIHVKAGHGLGLPLAGTLSNGAVRSTLARNSCLCASDEPSDCQQSQPDSTSCQSRADGCQSESGSWQNGSRRSITSEEARALACFDHIYNDLELNPREPTLDGIRTNSEYACGQYNLAYNDSDKMDDRDGGCSRTECRCNNERSKLDTHSCRGSAPETASPRNSCGAARENQGLSSAGRSDLGDGLEMPVVSAAGHVLSSFRHSAKKQLTTSNGNMLRSGEGTVTSRLKSGADDDILDGGSVVYRSDGTETDVDGTVVEHSYITCDNNDSQSEVICNVHAQVVHSSDELSGAHCHDGK